MSHYIKHLKHCRYSAWKTLFLFSANILITPHVMRSTLWYRQTHDNLTNNICSNSYETLYNFIYIRVHLLFTETAQHASFISRIALKNSCNLAFKFVNRYMSLTFLHTRRRGMSAKKDDLCSLQTLQGNEKAFCFVRSLESNVKEIGNDTTCYFIISVLFSIGNHNISTVQNKNPFSRTLWIFLTCSMHET